MKKLRRSLYLGYGINMVRNRLRVRKDKKGRHKGSTEKLQICWYIITAVQ